MQNEKCTKLEAIMSKESGMGRKRNALKLNKGMDKCDARSHGKQCGRPEKVSKGKNIQFSELEL